MSSFNNLLSRARILSEGNRSPWASAHPSFGTITKPMSDSGLSSAPLHTMQFIRELLYNLDIISHEELQMLKKPNDFAGKKQALLQVLKAKENEINAKSAEIEEMVLNTLDNFISEMRLRNVGKYDAQAQAKAEARAQAAAKASAKEIAKQMRQVKSGKEMDDALTDIITDESILVKVSIAWFLKGIEYDLGEPGFDIDEAALEKVMQETKGINTLSALRTYIRGLAVKPETHKIASYLQASIKPIEDFIKGKTSVEDEEMSMGAEEEEGKQEDKYFNQLKDAMAQAASRSGKQVEVIDGSEAIRRIKSGQITESSRTPRNIAAAMAAGTIFTGLGNFANNAIKNPSTFTNVASEVAGMFSSGNQEFLKKLNESDLAKVKKAMKGVTDAGTQVKLNPSAGTFKHSYQEAKQNLDNLVEGLRKQYKIDPSIKFVFENTSYTSMYLTEEASKNKSRVGQINESVSFKQKYKPKTSYQLEELRRYGL